MFKDASTEEIDEIMRRARQAAEVYRGVPLTSRRDLMYEISIGLEKNLSKLADVATRETNLPVTRLENEIKRTALQLRQYGDECVTANWMDIRVNTAGYQNVNVDLRKMQIPLGPVVVFGSSNFPFAFSTAGGDTACALAAGCPVIVKAHPAHPETSGLVANIISDAVRNKKLPDGVFSHVYGFSFDVGKYLVMHKETCAVGFTGSFRGGKQLFDWAAERDQPIPVFSEMGSINPVFLLGEKLLVDSKSLARDYASSITVGVGQFCTQPGIIIGVEGEGLDNFISELSTEIQSMQPQKMLHSGIAKAYKENREHALSQRGVNVLGRSAVSDNPFEGDPLIASVSADVFLENRKLHQEVFGPYSLIVTCRDISEMYRIAESLEGQITCSIIGNENELAKNVRLIDVIKNICGRIIVNGVPTGVTVCQAMHHGGPFPATTDSRFTSVGSDGIKRFTRPICFQNFPDSLFPDELKNSNPLNIWRVVNGEFTLNPIIGN